MYQIGVVGEESSIKGFLSLGFKIRGVTNSSDAQRELEKLKKDNCAIVFVTSEMYSKLDLEEYKTDPLFTVIPIPTLKSDSSVGVNRLKKAVEKAVGADILFNKD